MRLRRQRISFMSNDSRCYSYRCYCCCYCWSASSQETLIKCYFSFSSNKLYKKILSMTIPIMNTTTPRTLINENQSKKKRKKETGNIHRRFNLYSILQSYVERKKKIFTQSLVMMLNHSFFLLCLKSNNFLLKHMTVPLTQTSNSLETMTT